MEQELRESRVAPPLVARGHLYGLHPYTQYWLPSLFASVLQVYSLLICHVTHVRILWPQDPKYESGAAVAAKSIFKVYTCIWSLPANNVVASVVLVRRWVDSPVHLGKLIQHV